MMIRRSPSPVRAACAALAMTLAVAISAVGIVAPHTSIAGTGFDHELIQIDAEDARRELDELHRAVPGRAAWTALRDPRFDWTATPAGRPASLPRALWDSVDARLLAWRRVRLNGRQLDGIASRLGDRDDIRFLAAPDEGARSEGRTEYLAVLVDIGVPAAGDLGDASQVFFLVGMGSAGFPAASSLAARDVHRSGGEYLVEFGSYRGQSAAILGLYPEEPRSDSGDVRGNARPDYLAASSATATLVLLPRERIGSGFRFVTAYAAPDGGVVTDVLAADGIRAFAGTEGARPHIAGCASLFAGWREGGGTRAGEPDGSDGFASLTVRPGADATAEALATAALGLVRNSREDGTIDRVDPSAAERQADGSFRWDFLLTDPGRYTLDLDADDGDVGASDLRDELARALGGSTFVVGDVSGAGYPLGTPGCLAPILTQRVDEVPAGWITLVLPSAVELVPGGTWPFDAIACPPGAETTSSASGCAQLVDVTWTVGDDGVGSIDEHGVFTAIGDGVAAIEATVGETTTPAIPGNVRVVTRQATSRLQFADQAENEMRSIVAALMSAETMRSYLGSYQDTSPTEELGEWRAREWEAMFPAAALPHLTLLGPQPPSARVVSLDADGEVLDEITMLFTAMGADRWVTDPLLVIDVELAAAAPRLLELGGVPLASRVHVIRSEPGGRVVATVDGLEATATVVMDHLTSMPGETIL